MYYDLLKILFSGKDEQILQRVNELTELISGTVDEMFVTTINQSGNFRNYNQKPEISDKTLVLNAVLMMSLSEKNNNENLIKHNVTCSLLEDNGREIFLFLKGRIHLIQYIIKVNDFLFNQHITHKNAQINLIQETGRLLRNLEVRFLRLQKTNLYLHYALID